MRDLDEIVRLNEGYEPSQFVKNINALEPSAMPSPMRGPDFDLDKHTNDIALGASVDEMREHLRSEVPPRTFRTLWHVQYVSKDGDLCYVTTSPTYADAERFVAALEAHYRNFEITGPHEHDVTP